MCVCVCVCVSVCELLSHVQVFLTPWMVASQAPPSIESPDKNTGVGCHSLLQGIFLTQGLNPGLLHCRRIFYHLSHQGSLGGIGTRFNFPPDATKKADKIYETVTFMLQFPKFAIWIKFPGHCSGRENPGKVQKSL